MIATSAYRYADRSLTVGDRFDASVKDADLLRRAGLATDAPTRRYETSAMEPVTSTDEPKAKRHYRRRDLEAEP